MFSMAHRTKPGCTGETWYLQVGIDYSDDYDSKTTMLLGLSALMEIFPGATNRFKLHPLENNLILPILSSNDVEDGFPSSAVVVFKYFLVRDK